eukprot:TRINITY_DN8858_c0_g2_i6.p2 TRINITY_DN8858_c0_g2~~TRINITY_DN8858_c0_g2_i6.p2  ORF type:complete len:129 (-),score=15.42 TRINITY_DN8858_c0_g2_i6:67-453(-)
MVIIVRGLMAIVISAISVIVTIVIIDLRFLGIVDFSHSTPRSSSSASVLELDSSGISPNEPLLCYSRINHRHTLATVIVVIIAGRYPLTFPIVIYLDVPIIRALLPCPIIIVVIIITHIIIVIIQSGP